MTDEGHESKSLEERVRLLEGRMKEIENRLGGPVTGQQQTPELEPLDRSLAAAAVKDQRPKISVEMIRKSFHQMDILAGDVGQRIDFVFAFHGHLEKDARAFKGAVVIKDLFDQEIVRVILTHEAGLPMNGTTEWVGGMQFNQFMPQHQRLLTVAQNDITVSFDLESIIYTDGTRQAFD
jgi:hypothetical protein